MATQSSRDAAHGCAVTLGHSSVDAGLAARIKALSRHPSDCDCQGKEGGETIGEHHGLTGRVGEIKVTQVGGGRDWYA
jgi:hypothetical protein